MKTRIAIFKAGKHRAASGIEYTFTEADVAASADAYDKALHQAPYVLGHPKSDGPAWGWADKVVVDNGVMFVEHEKVDPAFEEGVDAGRYRFTSAAFYGPADPSNPKPGIYYLRHVGFLGAQPPAVKGLGPVAFGDDGDRVIEFDESGMNLAWLAGNVADGFRQIRDWVLGKWGQEEADKAVSPWTDRSATQIAADVRAEARAEPGAAFAERAAAVDAAVATALDERAAELDRRETVLAERESRTNANQVAFAETARVAARDDDGAFVDGLVTAGRLPPAFAGQVKTLMGVLDGDGAVSFAEGEAGPRDQFRQLLGGLGVSILFSEVARSGEAPGELGAFDIARETRALVDAAAARGETLSFAEAGAQVRASN